MFDALVPAAPDALQTIVPDALQKWCQENDLSATELADLSGYSVPYISLIMRGKRVPPWRVKVAIARALGIRVAEVFPPTDREAASA
jgi:transcriptional regulator with XRE-family HTH domain